MQTLAEYLKSRADAALRRVVRQAEAVTSEEALRDRRTNWPHQKWGIGQDGSIAGIVYHVIAWKQLTLPVFLPNGQPRLRNDFDPKASPDPDDWPALLYRLRQIGTEWNDALKGLEDADFDSLREWSGVKITLCDYITEVIQHDEQGAAQIEYLRQLHLSESKGS